jgi:RNA polymerase sigma factor (sigma-70 family)
MPVSPREVVRELKDGERVGCRHLIDLYRDRLIRDAIRLFGIRGVEAEELVSDVLLAVIHHIHSFEFRDSDRDFHLWVVAIFRNRIRDHVRKDAARLRAVPSLYLEEGAAERRKYRTPGNFSSASVHDWMEALRDDAGKENNNGSVSDLKLEIIADTLETLQPWERTLLCCRVADVPYDVIAQYTGKPAKTLKVYYGRVRKRFTAQVLRQFEEHHVHPGRDGSTKLTDPEGSATNINAEERVDL